MTATSPDLADLAALSRRFEDAPATEVVAWAVDTYGDGLVLASSFQDCVMLDIALRVAPDLEVVFLDTGLPLRGDDVVRRPGASSGTR